MPSGDEIQQYLTGAWRMMLGKPDGLRLLDLSADGFWNSFFAIVVALPAMVVGWVGLANELSQLPADLGGRFSIFARLATIDLAAWVLPLVVLVAVAPRVGLADRVVHIVVAGNWSSAVIAWIMLPPALLNLFWPGAADTADLISLALFVASMVLSWRMTNVAIGRGPAVASAVFAGMFFLSLLVFFVMQGVLGLAVDVQIPAE
jgi:hypothetical protein